MQKDEVHFNSPLRPYEYTVTCESVLLSHDAIANGCKYSSFTGQLNGYFRLLENAWQTNIIIN